MRKETIALLMVLLVLASGVAGYLIGAATQPTNNTTITLPRPHEQVILAAACYPLGNTGAIIATNVGALPVNITELFISDSSGANVDIGFGHGILINSTHYATLSHGIPYAGSNVTMQAMSMIGNLFEATCPSADQS